jgi:hypothetical protein
MKKTLLKIINRLIRYIGASSYDDFEIFIKDAVAFGYKIVVKEIFYSEYFNNSVDGFSLPCASFQGGTYYLILRGIKEDLFDITCNVVLGRFNPLSPSEIHSSKMKIKWQLASLNLIDLNTNF